MTPSSVAKETGYQAEEYVAHTLCKQHRFVLIKRNHTIRGAEIDLILHDRREDTLVFVEVKYRKWRHSGLDLASMLPLKKQQSLLRGAQHFLGTWDVIIPASQRFDFVLVHGTPGRFELAEHIQGAF